jgi:hypothetical protein
MAVLGCSRLLGVAVAPLLVFRLLLVASQTCKSVTAVC